MSPKDIMPYILKFVNVNLYGKSVLADVIKNLEVRRLSWIIQVGPKCHHMYPYNREAGRSTVVYHIMIFQ